MMGTLAAIVAAPAFSRIPVREVSMRSLHQVVSLTALLATASAVAVAQSTIAVPPNGLRFGCANIDVTAVYCGQSFTAPDVDNVLQEFTFLEVSVPSPSLSFPPSPVTFVLFAMVGPTLVGAPLFRQPVAPTVGFEALSFSPPGGLALQGGGRYAAMVFLEAAESVEFATGQPYAGGRAFSCAPVNPCVDRETLEQDIAFRATFTRIVPEPAAGSLLGLGLTAAAGLAGAARFRARFHRGR